MIKIKELSKGKNFFLFFFLFLLKSNKLLDIKWLVFCANPFITSIANICFHRKYGMGLRLDVMK